MSPRLFLWVLALRLYSSGGEFNALARPPSKFTDLNRFPLGCNCLIMNSHGWGRGLQGSLILFDTHAFAPQRQLSPREMPSHSAFLLVSTDFTPTPGIPLPSSLLQPNPKKTNLNLRKVNTPWQPSGGPRNLPKPTTVLCGELLRFTLNL